MEQPQPILDLVRRMNRLCHLLPESSKSSSTTISSVTGKLTQLGIQLCKDRVDGSNVGGVLKEDLYLNQVPHNRYVRKYFYDMSSKVS